MPISKNANIKVPSADVEFRSMREAFGHGLVKAAESDPRVVVLCADLTESTGLSEFRRKFPERFVEVGVAEQNLITVASGMAAMGKIPFIASYAVFSPGRNWEQLRTTVCYNDRPVKIIGTHAGLNVGPDGGSHQALEDIALMRVLPRMTVVSPSDSVEAEKVAREMLKVNGPAYVRLPREKSPVIMSESIDFQIGKASVVFEAMGGVGRKSVGLIATGPLVFNAIKAAIKLEASGMAVKVLNISSIKPLDETAIIDLAKEFGSIVTIEEHQIYGGLGGAIAECLAKHAPTPIEFIGVNDRFGQSGTASELIVKYNLSTEDIVEAANRAILRK